MTTNRRPNFLWINTHDLSAWHLGCYGDAYATTPNLDQLAAEGIRYTNAFTAGPICSPSRTSIFTGMHPTTLGTHHHRSFAIRPDHVRLLPQYLTDAGYISTQINTDINTYIEPDEWAHYLNPEEFWEKRDEHKPFFACFSLGATHASLFKLTPEQARKERSSLLLDEELHDPAAAPIPSFVPDTPLFRERMALFYDALTQVDYQVGEILKTLEECGLVDETIVVFWADHGSGYPRSKTHCYDDGLKIPLIVKFPEKYQHLAPNRPGSAVDDLVMHMDLGPSTLSLAGIPIPEHFQGCVLFGPQKSQPRQYVCSARDRLDNCNEVIRTIRTKKYRYIRNFLPQQPYASFYPDGGFFAAVPAEGTPERDFWETSCLPGEQKIHDPDGIFLMVGPPIAVHQHGLPERYKAYLVWQDAKPCEELYDIDNDPEQIDNLGHTPEFEPIKTQLRQQLFDWMVETRDLGLLDETEMVVRAAAYAGVNQAVGVHCHNFKRILETADLTRLGTQGRGELVERLTDPDSAVRYWATTGLLSFELDADTTQRLTILLDDESISVSLAAANVLGRAGQGAMTMQALTSALESDLVWARLRAAANLSYYTKEQLRSMKPLLPALRASLENKACFGPDHMSYIETMFAPFLHSQRDMIVNRWVIGRVIARIEQVELVRHKRNDREH
ncbi:MAG: sulfatase-like hydrolase/transferase [Chloroflexota bacterium]